VGARAVHRQFEHAITLKGKGGYSITKCKNTKVLYQSSVNRKEG